MRPGVARQYLDEVTRDFETYAQREYLGAVCGAGLDADTLLAGVRFVATRTVPDREPCLRDILGTRAVGPDKEEMDAACVDAMMQTTADRRAMARFFALVASDPRTRSGSYRMVTRALETLGPAANDALLSELAVPHHDEPRVRKLTRVLVQVSEVPPPEPIGAWARDGPERRREVVDAWREALVEAGKLATEPATDA